MPRRYRKRYRKNTTRRQVYKNKKKLELLSKAIEYKYFDKGFDNQDITTTGTSVCLNTVQLGDGVNNRTGNKVMSRRITIRGYLSNNQSGGTPQDCVVRVFVFRARDQNNQEQTLNLLMNSVGVNGHLEDEHKHRFQILVDKTFAMDTSQHSLIPFYMTHKCKNVVTYNGNAGTFADLEDGAYYIAYVSTIASAQDCPQIFWNMRYYFLDA